MRIPPRDRTPVSPSAAAAPGRSRPAPPARAAPPGRSSARVAGRGARSPRSRGRTGRAPGRCRSRCERSSCVSSCNSGGSCDDSTRDHRQVPSTQSEGGCTTGSCHRPAGRRTATSSRVLSVRLPSVEVMSRWSAQMSFDELGRPLRDVTFVVVDLETTGASVQAGCMITEIGAVKVRGGEVLGEFQTLVNPHAEIPPFIAVLTGITNSMVATSPPIESALPAFLEFAQGCVLVAHNAPFDIGFLKHFAAAPGRPWPGFEVLDTARLARRVITRDDAPNCKLSSLAIAFGSATTPNHRALSDARATVDVLHGLMERLGGLGVHTLEELQTFSAKVSTAQRRKRHLAEGLPHAPGVYLFRDDQARVLYIGTSRDLRTRVRSYFTASETRSRMGEMVGLASVVDGIECATPLEASVRELRLLAEHKPRYNRRSRFPEKVHFVKLTREPWPRLSLVRRVLDDDADYLGPFSSKKTAEKCLAALHDTFPIRQCSDRMPRVPGAGRSPCVLAEMGRCLSPCDGSVDEATYAVVVRQLRDTLLRRPDEVVDAINARMAALAGDERFEEAGHHRDRLAAFVRAAARTRVPSGPPGCPETSTS